MPDKNIATGNFNRQYLNIYIVIPGGYKNMYVICWRKLDLFYHNVDIH